jgi:hypothetical protein
MSAEFRGVQKPGNLASERKTTRSTASCTAGTDESSTVKEKLPEVGGEPKRVSIWAGGKQRNLPGVAPPPVSAGSPAASENEGEGVAGNTACCGVWTATRGRVEEAVVLVTSDENGFSKFTKGV